MGSIAIGSMGLLRGGRISEVRISEIVKILRQREAQTAPAEAACLAFRHKLMSSFETDVVAIANVNAVYTIAKVGKVWRLRTARNVFSRSAR